MDGCSRNFVYPIFEYLNCLLTLPEDLLQWVCSGKSHVFLVVPSYLLGAKRTQRHSEGIDVVIELYFPGNSHTLSRL
jgi:hypothetical protein